MSENKTAAYDVKEFTLDEVLQAISTAAGYSYARSGAAFRELVENRKKMREAQASLKEQP